MHITLKLGDLKWRIGGNDFPTQQLLSNFSTPCGNLIPTATIPLVRRVSRFFFFVRLKIRKLINETGLLHQRAKNQPFLKSRVLNDRVTTITFSHMCAKN